MTAHYSPCNSFPLGLGSELERQWEIYLPFASYFADVSCCLHITTIFLRTFIVITMINIRCLITCVE